MTTKLVRDKSRLAGAEVTCPHCGGDGQHHGPVPYRNCLRCGGYGTIILIDPTTYHGKEQNDGTASS